MEGQEKKILDYIKCLDGNNVDKAVIAALPPIWVEEQYKETKETVWYKPGGGFVKASNEFVVECCKKYPDRLIPFGNFNPMLYRSEQFLEREVKRLGLKGIKLHPPVQAFYPSDPQVVVFARKAAELGLPILFHTGPGSIGRDEYAEPKYIEDLATMVPEATIIMGHGGRPLSPWIVGKHKNLYIDTSFANIDLVLWERQSLGLLGYKLIDKNIIKMVGTEKILFASDTDPELTSFYRRTIDYVKSFEVSDEEKAMILGGNAKKILGL